MTWGMAFLILLGSSSASVSIIMLVIFYGDYMYEAGFEAGKCRKARRKR
jgi:hypothetical protein